MTETRIQREGEKTDKEKERERERETERGNKFGLLFWPTSFNARYGWITAGPVAFKQQAFVAAHLADVSQGYTPAE